MLFFQGLKSRTIFIVGAFVLSCGILLIISGPIASLIYNKFNAPNLALAMDLWDAKLAMNIGDHYFGKGAYDLTIAKRAYEHALRINPNIQLAHYSLARIDFIQSDFDGTLKEVNIELSKFPDNLRPLYMKALMYAYRGQDGDLGLSEQNFSKFIGWSPTEWAGYNDLIWVLEEEGKHQEALMVSDRSFKNARDAKSNPWLWNSRGVVELNLRDYRNARVSFTKAHDYARNITPEDWKKAYPGNDPSGYEKSIVAFKKMIQDNISTLNAKEE